MVINGRFQEFGHGSLGTAGFDAMQAALRLWWRLQNIEKLYVQKASSYSAYSYEYH